MKKKVRNKDLYYVKLLKYTKYHVIDIFMHAIIKDALIFGKDINEELHKRYKGDFSIPNVDCKIIMAKKIGNSFQDVISGVKYVNWGDPAEDGWRLACKRKCVLEGKYIKEEDVYELLRKLNENKLKFKLSYDEDYD